MFALARAAIVGCEDLDVGAHRVDPRRANEDSRHASHTLNVEFGLETRDLSAVAVASHRGVQHAVTPLIAATIKDFAGEQDEPGARAQDRQLLFELEGQSVLHTRGHEQVGDGGGLAPGHHERVDRLELFGRADLDDVSAQGFEHRGVFAHVALQRQDANARHYQPRSASRSSNVAVSNPFIAAPRPVETLATTEASSK